MGLNDTYAHAKSQILMIIPVPSVNQAYAMIINVESQRLNGISTGSSLADSHSEVALMSNKVSQGQYSGVNSQNGSNGGYRQRNYSDGRPNGRLIWFVISVILKVIPGKLVISSMDTPREKESPLILMPTMLLEAIKVMR